MRQVGQTDGRGLPIYEDFDRGQAGHYMSPADRAELAELLGLKEVHCQGHSIPASFEHRTEYLQRSAGVAVETFGTQYWD
jgi:hypothetical protein